MPDSSALTCVVDDLWQGSRQGPSVVSLQNGVLTPVGSVAERRHAADAGLPRLRKKLMPGIIDHHVHLGLVDRQRLADGPLVEVQDLGWSLADVLHWRAAPPHGVTIKVAGPFHTAPGGYPSGRAWAPDSAVRQIVDAADARRAVASAAQAGVDAIKVALNSDMPLLDDELLRELIEGAHRAGLPAIVHAEGVGQAARAIRAGADKLVHAPWSETLPDAVLNEALHTTTWISTLAIHDGPARGTAITNLRRFHAQGGHVEYGTDMGNGPVPVGPSGPELTALEQAGLTVDDLIAAMTSASATALPVDRTLACDLPLPRSATELSDWLAACRRLSATVLQELR